MSELRPTLVTSTEPAVSDATALYMIADAVANRTSLLHGQLANRRGQVCAIGAFFDRNPGASLHDDLIDEVALYNDSMPEVSRRVRRYRVLRWLRWRLRVLERQSLRRLR